MRKAVARRIAALWQRTYRAQYQFGLWKLRYGNIAFYAVLFLLVSASAYLSPTLQNVLASYYSTEHAIKGLRGLILNVGSALIGAAAIVTSLVLFAMQVNIAYSGEAGKRFRCMPVHDYDSCRYVERACALLIAGGRSSSVG